MSSSYGKAFRITTFGESHGGAVGVVIDGCPPRLDFDLELVQHELDRRRPGQSRLTTQRSEPDEVEVLSGVFEGRTLGTSIALVVRNLDARPGAYDEMADLFRPSHADFTTEAKYGLRNWQGGGRASARETVGRVAAGAVAKMLLQRVTDIEVVAWVQQVHNVIAEVNEDSVSIDTVDAHETRCPDAKAAEVMSEAILQARRDGDSLGGIVRTVVRNSPPGMGDPVFDKLDATLAAAMLSIPAAKGFEIGSGFSGIAMTGREHNDPFIVDQDNKPATTTNHSGGVQGGISNGMPITFNVAFKPTATIASPQQTINRSGEPVTLEAKGRHDPCVLPRAVPIVEAMTWLTLADHWLRQRSVDVLD